MQPLLEIIGHFLGICPDSTGHITLIDIFSTYTPNIEHIIVYVKDVTGQINKPKN